MKDSRGEKKKNATRIAALVIAGVMILSVVGAAIMSQVW